MVREDIVEILNNEDMSLQDKKSAILPYLEKRPNIINDFSRNKKNNYKNIASVLLGKKEWMGFLSEQGVAIDYSSRNKIGQNVVHLYVKNMLHRDLNENDKNVFALFGDNINQEDIEGNTPLSIILEKKVLYHKDWPKRFEYVDLLFENGAKFLSNDKINDVIISLCHTVDAEAIKYLLSKGMSVNIEMNNKTLLHFLSDKSKYSSFSENYYEDRLVLFNLLIENGFNFKRINEMDSTFFYNFLYNNNQIEKNKDIIHFIKNSGINHLLTLREVLSLIHKSFYKNSIDSLKKILNNFDSVDINYKGEKDNLNLLSLLFIERDTITVPREKDFYCELIYFLIENNINLNTNVRCFDQDSVISYCYHGTIYSEKSNRPVGKVHIISELMESLRYKESAYSQPVLKYIIDNFQGEAFLPIRMPFGDFFVYCSSNKECEDSLLRLLSKNEVNNWQEITQNQYIDNTVRNKYLETPINRRCHLKNILSEFLRINEKNNNFNISEAYYNFAYKEDLDNDSLFSKQEILDTLKIIEVPSYEKKKINIKKELEVLITTEIERKKLQETYLNVSIKTPIKRI